MLQLNADRLDQVTQAAFNATTNHRDARRWPAAIIRARQIAESNPYVELTEAGLLLLSDSGALYGGVTDRNCPCKAFAKHQPCKHRALYRLLVRYSETAH
jgi:hypothetical protein